MQWSNALDDGQIMGVMSDEGRGLYRGLYWGEETRHGVLDIDAGSKYHDALELRELVRKFAAVGLPLVVKLLIKWRGMANYLAQT